MVTEDRGGGARQGFTAGKHEERRLSAETKALNDCPVRLRRLAVPRDRQGSPEGGAKASRRR